MILDQFIPPGKRLRGEFSLWLADAAAPAPGPGPGPSPTPQPQPGESAVPADAALVKTDAPGGLWYVEWDRIDRLGEDWKYSDQKELPGEAWNRDPQSGETDIYFTLIGQFHNSAFGMRWRGYYKAMTSGVHLFRVVARGAFDVTIGGVVIVDDGTNEKTEYTKAITLEAGKFYAVDVGICTKATDKVAALSVRLGFFENGQFAPLPSTRCYPPAAMPAPKLPADPIVPPPATDWTGYQTKLTRPLSAENSYWRKDRSKDAIDPGSAKMIAALNNVRLHPVFGQGGVGIPIQEVAGDTPTTAVAFQYADESDAGPYPIPAKPVIESGSDLHANFLTPDGALYELFELTGGPGSWHAGSGAVWRADKDTTRPKYWTSADAAGLPIAPGLAVFDELMTAGAGHMLRFTAGRSRRAFVEPANHFAAPTSASGDELLPMGAVLRLKAATDLSGLKPQARAVAEWLKKYGMIMADNGNPAFLGLCGTPDSRWSDDDLATLKTLHANDFEVLKLPPIIT